MKHPILLFDGECNFCRASVHWLVEHDPDGAIHYASLGSTVAERLLHQHGVAPERVESVVLLDRGRAYFKSDAVFEALRHLRSGWRGASVLRFIPRPVRDLGYTLVSENRYWISRAVGTIDHRYEPTGNIRSRFLSTAPEP